MNISVIGAGSFGVALSRLLKNNGHNLKIWAHSKEVLNQLKENNKINTLPNVILQSGIEYSSDFEFVLKDTELIVIAVASNYVREVVNKIKEYIKDNTIIVVVAKGIEFGTDYVMSEVIEDEIKNKSFKNVKVVALSGPTHAEEVGLDMPTAIVAASKDKEAALLVQNVFMNEYFRVYTNEDIKGVEFCGAFKNVFALACGISTGVGYGDNLKAAIITRGLKEMVRMGSVFNCNIETFYGLAGVGDLIVTATSEHSRNNRCGKYIGEGLSIDEAIKKVGMVVEGINVLPSVIRIMKKYNIDMPICNGINEIINNNKNPKEIINKLMLREKKSE